MLGDGTIGSWWRKVWPLGARRDKPPANDAMFIDVMADFRASSASGWPGSRRAAWQVRSRSAAKP